MSNNSLHLEKDNSSHLNQKLSKEMLQKQKLKLQEEKERKRLEELLERKIEEADKKEIKQKEIAKKKAKKNKPVGSGTEVIPTVSLDDFKNNKNNTPKESFIKRLINKIRSNRKKKKEAKKLEIEEKKRLKAEKELAKNNSNLKIKEATNAKEEARNKKIAEKNAAKEERQRQKEELKRQKEEEKKRLKAENEILSSKSNVAGADITDPKKMAKEDLKKKKQEEKERIKKEKEEAKARKDELRKARLKEKYAEEVKRKKEKEDKDILIITERKEKEKKIKKEKEQARKERKEKALLIKKAQEESKEKARKERKTLSEKASDWYNNLSFVKDRKNRRELQRQTLLIDFEGADAVRSEEKIMYKYVAKSNETGKVETGYFAAFSKLDVHSFLMAEGYEVYEITPQKNIAKSLTIFAPKFSANDLDFFLTQLSTFLRSGITLVESVKILSKQSKKKSHKNIYKSIIYELTMGENFSEALSKQGNIFPRLLINMVKTSELTGDLPETLDDMADYYRETEKTRKQMISAVSYPLIVLVFAIAILIFMMVKVVPQFVGIYEDMETGLPRITVAIINISNFLKANWIYLIVGLIIFIIIFIILFKTIKVFKSLVQTLVMNVPIIGKIIIYNEVTMFTKTFASLLKHNVYITDCMEVLSKITNNEVYKMLIFDTITNLARGEAISNSFKNHWAFPTIAYEMILTGEKTGQLGVMMEKVANYYQEQHKNAVNQIKAFIEPVMIIILAAIVGVVLLSVVIPMFDMYENLSAQTA